MNKKILLKTATITVPMLTLGILAGSVASAATATKTDVSEHPKRVMFFRHGDMKPGRMDETKMQKHKDVATAVENNDYAKFKEFTADAPFADKVNETSFAKIVQAHKLMKQAQTLMEESGLRMPMGHPGMRTKVFNGRVDAPAENQ